MKAKDFMTQSPAFCTPEDSVIHAARLMEANDCGSLPVVESISSRRLVGIVTDRDIALRVLGKGLPPDTKLKDVMTPKAIFSRRDDDLEKVESLMALHQVRRIPVVDEDGTCVGIIAQADLARRRGVVSPGDFAGVVERISAPLAGGPHGAGGGVDD